MAVRTSVDNGCLTIDNGHMAVRLALTFPAGGDCVGPILGVRLPDGAWVGRQALSGLDLTGGEGRLVDADGPRPRYEARLLFADGGRYELHVEPLPGESAVLVREIMHGAAVTMRLGLSGWALTAVAMHGLPGQPALVADPATYAAPYGVVPGAVASLGAQSIFGQIGTPWLALADARSALAVLVCRGGDWQFPGDNTLRLLRDKGGLALVGEARHGTREWLLVAGPAADWMPKPGEPATALSELRRRVSDLPPAKTQGWCLDIEDPEPGPKLWTDAANLAAARQRLAAPEWAGLAESMPWHEFENRIYSEDEAACCGLSGTTHSFPVGIEWLRTGDPAMAARLVSEVRAWSEAAAERFRRQGFLGNGLDCVYLRTLKHCLYWYDALRGSGQMPAADAVAIRRSLLFCAYCQFDRDYFDYESAYAAADSEHSLRRFLLEEDYSDTMGCQNFHADLFTFIGSVGLAFPQHPMAETWVDHAEAMCRLNLECFVTPDGTYVESDNYFIHFLGLLYYFGYALLRAGRPGLIDHPRLRAGLEYFVRSQTPPLRHTGAPHTAWYGTYTDRPRERPVCQVPPLGDAGLNWAGQACPSFLHHAADLYANEYPELAGWLEWAWQRGGRPLAQYSFIVQEALTQAIDGPVPREYPLRSCELEGHGVMMRAAVGQPYETAVLVSTGRATSHMHFDAGSLMLWHAGVPLIVDPGYVHDERTPARQYAGESWKHSTVTFGPGWNGYLGMEHRQAPLAVRLGDEFDYVLCDLSQNNQRDGSWRAIRRIVSIEHYRQVLFAKGRYLLIKDRICRSVYPGTWRLWALADEAQVSGNRVRLIGRYGVDLMVTFLQPAAPAIATRRFSTALGIEVEQAPELDFLVLLQPMLPGDAVCEASLSGDAVAVSAPEWTERVWLDPMPGMGNASYRNRGRKVADSANPVRPRCAVVRDGVTTVIHGGG